MDPGSIMVAMPKMDEGPIRILQTTGQGVASRGTEGGGHGVATMNRTSLIVATMEATMKGILEFLGSGEGALPKASTSVHRITTASLNHPLVAGLAPHLEPKKPAAVMGFMYAKLPLGRFEDVELRRPSAIFFSDSYGRFSLPEITVLKALFPTNSYSCWVLGPHSLRRA